MNSTDNCDSARLNVKQSASAAQPQRFHTGWVLAVIFLAGLVLRLVVTGLPRIARWDEAAYVMIANNLLAGNGYRELVGALDLQQPPMIGLLAMVGLALRLPLAWAAAGPAHVMLGALVVLPLYGLGRAMAGRQVGLLAALLGAIHPALAVSPLYWSTMTEPPYTLFVLTGLYATNRCAQGLAGEPAPPRRRSLGWAALMGISFGLGYLVRPEALFFLTVAILYLAIVWFTSGRRQVSRLVSSAALAAALTVLLALPYILYLHQSTGLWLASGKQGVSMDISWAYANDSQAMHDQAVASLDPSGQEILWLSPQGFDKTLTGWIAEDPRRFVVLVRKNIGDTWHALFHEDLFTPWMVVLMGLGLFSQPWTRTRLRSELLLLLAFLPLLSLWLFFVLSRFLTVYVGIGLIWAAVGLAQLTRWAGATGQNLIYGTTGPQIGSARRAMVSLLRVLPVAATVTLLLLGGIDVINKEVPRLPFWRVEAAHRLAELTPPGSPVMTRNSEIALYADRPMVAYPNADWADVLAYGQARGAHFLVVDDKEILEIRPQQASLLATSAGGLPAGITLVDRLERAGRTILIFEFAPP